MSEFTDADADAEARLAEDFAPWINDMDIVVELVTPGAAVLRIPQSVRLNRDGGAMCGQAIMSLADTAMAFAVASSVGDWVPMTTVNQTSSFLRPADGKELYAEARVIKRGRTIMYGEVILHSGIREKPVAHVTSTYMLL
jgi:uncharacterized protein (TIGR00369 family)